MSRSAGIPPQGRSPDVLDMFRSEVRFYQGIAPRVGLRVPACYEAEAGPVGIRLVLKDLSTWTEGADPCDVAALLAGFHRRSEGRPSDRWPWLRPVGAAADLIGARYDQCWPAIDARSDLADDLRQVAAQLYRGVAKVERREAGDGPLTLVYGNASLRNVRGGPQGEIAFVDWDDVREGPGAADLAWLLISSVPAPRWPEVVAAHRRGRDLD